MCEFFQLFLYIVIVPCAILVSAIFFFEVLVNEILKLLENYEVLENCKIFKNVSYFLLSIRRVAIATILSLISMIIVIGISSAIENLSFWPSHPLFLQTIMTFGISFVLYSIYFNSTLQERFSSIERRLNTKIDQLIRKKLGNTIEEIASTSQSEEYSQYETLKEKNNTVSKMILVYLDSFILLMTGLALLLNASFIAPFMFKDNGDMNEYLMYPFILVFISLIISKFHANHEDVEMITFKKSSM